MTQQYDVGVVGYGATAAVLVDLLLQRGLSVVVFDKWPGVLEIPRAAHLDDETMRTFQTLGIPKDLSETIIPSAPYSIYNALDQRVAGLGAIKAEPTDQGWLSDYFFVQPAVEHYLRNKARNNGAVIKLGCEVVGLDERPNDILLTYRETVQAGDGAEQQVAARFVVGADGAGSFVRNHAGFDWEELAKSQRWMIVDIRVHDGVDLGLAREAWTKATPEETITYVPMPQNMQRFEFSMAESLNEADVKSDEAIKAFIGKWFKPADYDVLRAHVYHFHSRVAKRWRKGRILIAGDAAHLTPPFLGQGACAGIRDALNLGWKLSRVVKGVSPDSLLDTYESERRPHAYALVNIAGAIGNMLQWMAQAGPEEVAGMQKQNYAHTQMARPPMGPGLYSASAKAGGTLSPQPRLFDGKLLDDVVGYNFAVVGDPALISSLLPKTIAALETLGAVIVPDGGDAVREALDAIGASAMLVRPDRYLYGAVDTAAAMDAMVEQLTHALRELESV